MKKLILMLLAGSFAVTALAHDNGIRKKPLISKDDKDNIAQILCFLGAAGAGLTAYTAKARDTKAIAAIVTLALTAGCVIKIKQRAETHGYDSSFDFIIDDALAKAKGIISGVWEKSRINFNIFAN